MGTAAAVPLGPPIRPHELKQGGAVVHADGVTVTCALVDHPPVQPALAYRLDSSDRSVVFSGDTRPAKALIELAREADVLVHEVIWPTAIDRLLSGAYNAEALKKSILSHHTSAEEAGRVAAEARVKMLVLSHFVPAEDTEITNEMWTAAVQRGGYRGPIVLGKDLLEI